MNGMLIIYKLRQTGNDNNASACSNNGDDAILSLSLLQHTEWHPNYRQKSGLTNSKGEFLVMLPKLLITAL
jgi:hypothetical protein